MRYELGVKLCKLQKFCHCKYNVNAVAFLTINNSGMAQGLKTWVGNEVVSNAAAAAAVGAFYSGKIWVGCPPASATPNMNCKLLIWDTTGPTFAIHHRFVVSRERTT